MTLLATRTVVSVLGECSSQLVAFDFSKKDPKKDGDSPTLATIDPQNTSNKISLGTRWNWGTQGLSVCKVGSNVQTGTLVEVPLVQRGRHVAWSVHLAPQLQCKARRASCASEATLLVPFDWLEAPQILECPHSGTGLLLGPCRFTPSFQSSNFSISHLSFRAAHRAIPEISQSSETGEAVSYQVSNKSACCICCFNKQRRRIQHGDTKATRAANAQRDQPWPDA